MNVYSSSVVSSLSQMSVDSRDLKSTQNDVNTLITLLLLCFDDDDQKQSVESILLRRVENVAQHAQRAFETDETFTSREAIGCVVVERRRPRNAFDGGGGTKR